MRSQTALNGPKQAVHINNLVRLQSSHQEQHSVKCQQQNSFMEQRRKQQPELHPLETERERAQCFFAKIFTWQFRTMSVSSSPFATVN